MDAKAEAERILATIGNERTGTAEGALDEIGKIVSEIIYSTQQEAALEWSDATRHDVKCAIVGNTPLCTCGAHDKLRILQGELSQKLRDLSRKEES